MADSPALSTPDTASGTRVDAARFKQAARGFASGVTVVTTRHDDQVYGITVSAFMTLSLEPLQILVSIRKGNRLHDMILESRRFVVNILREEQRKVSEYFARSGRPTHTETFPEVETYPDVTGAPVIKDCLSYFDCYLATAYPAGDHTIFIGDVVAAGASEGKPLLYFSGEYRGLREWAAHAPATLDLWYV